ncbi:hypothetical protein PUN28_010227 [Cardiocondyla obscurior]|uniref:Uncharacterized protein n=1 Tax=Cardiocondyla obscurior TaxID=286306 RepID=A0AAW2FSU4_9HYME
MLLGAGASIWRENRRERRVSSPYRRQSLAPAIISILIFETVKAYEKKSAISRGLSYRIRDTFYFLIILELFFNYFEYNTKKKRIYQKFCYVFLKTRERKRKREGRKRQRRKVFRINYQVELYNCYRFAWSADGSTRDEGFPCQRRLPFTIALN